MECITSCESSLELLAIISIWLGITYLIGMAIEYYQRNNK